MLATRSRGFSASQSAARRLPRGLAQARQGWRRDGWMMRTSRRVPVLLLVAVAVTLTLRPELLRRGGEFVNLTTAQPKLLVTSQTLQLGSSVAGGISPDPQVAKGCERRGLGSVWFIRRHTTQVNSYAVRDGNQGIDDLASSPIGRQLSR